LTKLTAKSLLIKISKNS